MISKQDFPSINERAPGGVKADGSSYKVLVVDDSIFVSKQIGQILTSEGYEVVAISALGKEELVKKSLLLGAKNYIVKPLDRKKVLERIAAVLSK